MAMGFYLLAFSFSFLLLFPDAMGFASCEGLNLGVGYRWGFRVLSVREKEWSGNGF